MAKEVIKKNADPLALWGEEENTGFEGTTSEDYALPFVKLLQKMSPEVDESDGRFVPGAKPGMFLNSATNELYDSIEVVPCHYRRAMVEWKDRDTGGGFVAQHEVGFEQGLDRDESGRHLMKNGNYVVDTRYHFCEMIRPDGEVEHVVLSLSSTQIKKSRQWMNLMRTCSAKTGAGQPIMYSGIYTVRSADEENAKGKFKGYRIEFKSIIQTPELATRAREAADMFRAAAAMVKPPSEDAPQTGGKKDEEIPF